MPLIIAQPASAAPLIQNNSDCEVLRQEGIELQNQGQYEEALSTFQAALACYQSASGSHRMGEATVLNNNSANAQATSPKNR